MTTDQKCRAIIEHIVAACNEYLGDTHAAFVFSPDGGHCSLTIHNKHGHTHVGNWWDAPNDKSFDELVDQLHAILIHGRGLSYA